MPCDRGRPAPDRRAWRWADARSRSASCRRRRAGTAGRFAPAPSARAGRDRSSSAGRGRARPGRSRRYAAACGWQRWAWPTGAVRPWKLYWRLAGAFQQASRAGNAGSGGDCVVVRQFLNQFFDSQRGNWPGSARPAARQSRGSGLGRILADVVGTGRGAWSGHACAGTHPGWPPRLRRCCAACRDGAKNPQALGSCRGFHASAIRRIIGPAFGRF